MFVPPRDPLKEYLQGLQPQASRNGSILTRALRPSNLLATAKALVFEILLLRMVVFYVMVPVLLAIFMLVSVFGDDMDPFGQGLSILGLVAVVLTLTGRIRAALPGGTDASALLGGLLKAHLGWGILGFVITVVLLFAGAADTVQKTLALLWPGILAGLLLWHCFAMACPRRAQELGATLLNRRS